MAVFIGAIKKSKNELTEVQKILLNSLKQVATKTPTEKLKIALNDLKANYKKYSKSKLTTESDNLYNKNQRLIIIQELRKRKA